MPVEPYFKTTFEAAGHWKKTGNILILYKCSDKCVYMGVYVFNSFADGVIEDTAAYLSDNLFVGFARLGNQGLAFQIDFYESVDRDMDTQKFNTNHISCLPASYVHFHTHMQTPKGTLLPVVKINFEKAGF